jgi:hypothetical protein
MVLCPSPPSLKQFQRVLSVTVAQICRLAVETIGLRGPFGALFVGLSQKELNCLAQFLLKDNDVEHQPQFNALGHHPGLRGGFV